MSLISDSLEIWEKKYTKDEEPLLSLCHVTQYSKINNIFEKEKLILTKCGVFDKKLLYFSYGIPCYSPYSKPTQDKNLYPIAFLFSKKILQNIDYFFPFDTGLIYGKNKIIDKRTKKKFEPCADFFIKKNPDKFVKVLYGTNKNYFKGDPFKLPTDENSNLKKVSEYLNKDLTKRGVDIRQHTIECISKNEILFENLLWIGYPDFLAENVNKFVLTCMSKYSNKIDTNLYRTHRNHNPSAYVILLNDKIQEKFYERGIFK